ncbi:hypothetical protein [Micromonospora thermarum]|uniref:Uncharacterized protein n=1 Tax=Micromonospora thermarum TaxID=2720024 RepID=A0ABX0Z574_9ACTN|nr:hypothetical protein [Micromonospora thermarum]NJP32996.1 hypothetical protein [Micromonospora thermarum]
MFTEFHRVLAPGGPVMLAFQVGDERYHRDEAFGKPIHLDWYRHRPDAVADLLRDAGFETWVRVVKEAEGTERTPQAFVIARKPATAA